MIMIPLRVLHSTRRIPCINTSLKSGSIFCTISKQFRTVSSLQKPKTTYITTPIFYVNAAPHVGHLYTLVLSDILKRWHVLKGKEVVLCTGTDEHGMKIQRAAEDAEIDTKEFCDQNAEVFKNLAESLNLSHDHFVRTTDPDHRFAVQHFWLMLQERGYIYESKHEGWYSVSDETFYPESAITRAMNPSTGKTFMASIETGKEVEWTSEINYHFRLSKLRDQLLQFYAENPKFIVPEARMKQIVSQVEEGLSDLSVSRPHNRLSWGIPVPGDETQTIYVWLDALVNYLTKAGYPFQIPGTPGIWPADIQVIGKDITRFHCIYWPAFLMALDLSPPKQILTHAHWTLGKRKMSKSDGNVVNPFFAIDRFGVDPLRFYMAYDGGILNDADYENSFITARYKKCLYGGLGNLASRMVRGPWDIKRSVEVQTQLPEGDLTQENLQLWTQLKELPDMISRHFDDLDSGAALRSIMEIIFATNAYLQKMEPWKMENDSPDVHKVVYLCVESLRICGILLQPFMPIKMTTMLDWLGVDPQHRRFEDAQAGIDHNYGTFQGTKLPKGAEGALFPPLTTDFWEAKDLKGVKDKRGRPVRNIVELVMNLEKNVYC